MTSDTAPPSPTDASLAGTARRAAEDDATAGSLARPRIERLSGLVGASVLAAAVLGNFGLRAGVASAATAAAVVAATIAVHRSGSERTADGGVALRWAGAAIVAGMCVPLRASPWLTGIDAAAVVIALAGCALAGSGFRFRVATSALLEALGRGLQAVFAPAIAVRSVLPAAPRRAQWAAPLVRGLLLAVLPVLALGALLASADAVFAEVVTIDLDPGPVAGHVALTIFLGVVLTGLIAVAASGSVRVERDWRPVGHVEAIVVLAAVGMLFALFAGVQLYGALGRADAFLAAEGLTYAEYARSGYFQLLWVAALTAIGLVGIRMLVSEEPSRRAATVRVLGAAVSLLTLVVVAVAIVRLDLYTDEFGLTMLRWYSRAFAVVLGIGFALVALGHLPRLERRLPVALCSLVAAAMLLVNVLNPEARVAEHNLGRVDAATELDADYLIGLSADAWPVLLDQADLVTSNLGPSRLSAEDRFAAACRSAAEPGGFGLLGANVARLRISCG